LDTLGAKDHSGLKQFVKKGLLLVHEAHYLGADLSKGFADEFRVEIVGGPLELLLGEWHAGPNYLVVDDIRGRDEHHEDAVVTQIDKLDMLQAITRQRR